jgi:arylsulfatase A-like enzyme
MRYLALTLVCTLASTARATNYLILIADDVGVDKVSSYQGDFDAGLLAHTPNTVTIDQLAARGLRFTRAWATPLCSPTRASFQTGLQPFRTGIGTALGERAAGLDLQRFPTTIATTFKTLGYATGYFGKWHIGTSDDAGALGNPDGAVYRVAPAPAIAGWDRFYGNFEGEPGNYFDWTRIGWVGGESTGYMGQETMHSTKAYVDVATHWINERDAGWLAVVAFNAGHSPNTASSQWGYDASVNGKTDFYSASLSCLATHSCDDGGTSEIYKSVYQGLVEDMDAKIYDLLAGIDTAKLDDTIIVFFGDNGTPVAVQEGPWANGRGKGTTYENGVRVPYIVTDGHRWRVNDGGVITTPRAINAQVHARDIFQSLYEHATGATLSGLDSVSWLPCFTTSDVFCGFSTRYGYTETFTKPGALTSAKVAIHYGWDKLVSVYDPAAGCMTAEFYDLQADPMESTPRSWTGPRGQVLKDSFVAVHQDAGPGTWAYTSTGAILPFCP